MKKRIRKFVAAVQELYCEYIDVCTKIGRGYRDLEKDYIPPHLYLAMFRKIAEYNEIPWDSEEFFKEMSCNRKKEYYCSNDLIQEILKSLGEKEWSGYKITEYYCEVEGEDEEDDDEETEKDGKDEEKNNIDKKESKENVRESREIFTGNAGNR